MNTKVKKYLWTFVIGGLLSVLTEAVFQVLQSLPISQGLCVTLTLGIMALFGMAATLAGVYEKLEALANMGAFLPYSGLIAAIIETSGAKTRERKSFWETAMAGLRTPFFIFGISVSFCMLLAIFIYFIR